MGWFNDQIEERTRRDSREFTFTMSQIANAVLDKHNSYSEHEGGAMAEVLRYFRYPMPEIPADIAEFDERLEFVTHQYGIMYRKIVLDGDWWKDSTGAILAFRSDNDVAVALIPRKSGGFMYFDVDKAKYVRVNAKNQAVFKREAILLYKPLPMKKLVPSDLVKYIFGQMTTFDLLSVFIASLACTLLSLSMSRLYGILMGDVIKNGEFPLLYAMMTFIVSLLIAQVLMLMIKFASVRRVTYRVSATFQAAFMARLLLLPAGFFRKCKSGELSGYIRQIEVLCEQFVSDVLAWGLALLLSLLFLVQIFRFAPALTVPTICVLALIVLFSVATYIVQRTRGLKLAKVQAEEDGISYELISGVQKIKIANAEKRAFSRWGKYYNAWLNETYNPHPLLKYNSLFALLLASIGMVAIYYFAAESGVKVSDYYAFNNAYAIVTGAFMSLLLSVSKKLAVMRSTIDAIRPILDTEPESYGKKRAACKTKGSIELSGVSFRYSDDGPMVIDDLSLEIKAGENVAIVGASGCGKTTLLRLLMGFEKPVKGTIFYDGENIMDLDIRSVRKMFGAVLQDDKLYKDDIFTNITSIAPWATMEDAWKAAETACIAEDIRNMPLGMNTKISEGNGGISGGQRQRILIARAILSNPKILIFDEATSALDNIAQKKISEAVDTLKCTRIVIAHRLSTIKQCDRIVFLENGHIVEEGTYAELIALNGRFSHLIERQQLQDGECAE